MDRPTFESGANCHSVNWTDSERQVWKGIPLWLLVGRVDDSLEHGSDAFNRTLADQGYTVQLIAADGYKIELNSTFVTLNNDIIVANEMNDMPLLEEFWPLRLVGAALTKSQMIRNIVD